MTALKLANRAVPIDSIEIFRPVREAANAAKVIIRGVKTLVALEEKAEKAGGAGHLVAAENASRFRFKAFLNFEPLIHKRVKCKMKVHRLVKIYFL